jgi:regulator of sigma E protease
MDSFVDLMQLIASNVWIYGVTFLFILSLLVFVHEWGHYIVARMCGVKVEAFSIGFGKEIFGWTDKHGTRWKFAMIPLGGYVKMFGDVDPTSSGHKEGVEQEDGVVRPFSSNEKNVAFFAKPVWQRALIVFAGPGINFLFAILVLAVLYCSVGKPVTPPIASAIEIGAAADTAGFEPHDKILRINGKAIISFDDVRRTVMLGLDTPLKFDILRGDKEMSLTAVPKKVEEEDRFGFKHEKGYLGLIGPANGLDITKIKAVGSADVSENPAKARELLLANMDKVVDIRLNRGGTEDAVLRIKPPADLNAHLSEGDSKEFNALVLGVRPGDELIKFNPATGLVQATVATWDILRDTLKAIWQMVTGTRSASELGGIIRIGAIAGDMASQGVIALATFTALLSINLGLINLFPIPMLDGGHLVFYAAEAIKGKPLSERVQEYAFRFGLVVLVTLMVFANLNDIIQLIL